MSGTNNDETNVTIDREQTTDQMETHLNNGSDNQDCDVSGSDKNVEQEEGGGDEQEPVAETEIDHKKEDSVETTTSAESSSTSGETSTKIAPELTLCVLRGRVRKFYYQAVYDVISQHISIGSVFIKAMKNKPATYGFVYFKNVEDIETFLNKCVYREENNAYTLSVNGEESLIFRRYDRNHESRREQTETTNTQTETSAKPPHRDNFQRTTQPRNNNTRNTKTEGSVRNPRNARAASSEESNTSIPERVEHQSDVDIYNAPCNKLFVKGLPLKNTQKVLDDLFDGVEVDRMSIRIHNGYAIAFVDVKDGDIGRRFIKASYMNKGIDCDGSLITIRFNRTSLNQRQ